MYFQLLLTYETYHVSFFILAARKPKAEFCKMNVAFPQQTLKLLFLLILAAEKGK